MSANTSPDSIVYPVSTDQVAPLETVFANMATSIQTALNGRAVKNYRWANSTARGSQTGMQAGDLGYQVDSGDTYRYSGSDWVLWIRTLTTFTPSWTNFTPSGTNTGAYSVVAGWAHVRVYSTGAVSGSNASITLPINSVTTAASSGVTLAGSGIFVDASAGTAGLYPAVVNYISTSLARPRIATSPLTYPNATTPFTWVSDDAIVLDLHYPVSS